MVATVPPKLRGALREYVIGLGTRDAHRMVQAYADAGVLLPGADLRRLEALHDEMFRRFAGVRLGQMRDLAMAQAEQLLHEYRDIIQEMPFQLPADILFVGRAVGILSGLATSLDPDFDPWAAIVPFAERLATEETGSGLRAALNEVAALGRLALALPARIDRVLRQAERGEIMVQTGLAPDAARALRRIERAADRLAWAVVFAGLLIGGVLLRASEGVSPLSTGLLVAAGVALAWGVTRR
jgi:predicted unusual protein kinase regulating ubiquinone biosynthesis (AarF/ABC1/UbiB family)